MFDIFKNTENQYIKMKPMEYEEVDTNISSENDGRT